MLGVTFGLAYVAAWFVLTDVTAVAYWGWEAQLHFTTRLYLTVAACFILLLFIIAIQLNPEFLRDYPRIKWPFQPKEERREFADETIPMFREFVSAACLDFLLCGPRCALYGVATVRRAVRLLFFDVKTSAHILTLLLQSGRRVSFAEIGQTVPRVFSRRILVQLNDINGVVFLTQDPIGLSLTSDLRAELREAFKGEMPRFARPEPEPSYTPEVEAEAVDELVECYRLLGLKPSATLREVKAAYRKHLKNCHPDRFHDFGSDWRDMAARKTRDLIRAYETIAAARAEVVR